MQKHTLLILIITFAVGCSSPTKPTTTTTTATTTPASATPGAERDIRESDRWQH